MDRLNECERDKNQNVPHRGPLLPIYKVMQVTIAIRKVASFDIYNRFLVGYSDLVS